MTIEPHGERTLDLNTLLRDLGDDVDDEFEEGSVSVEYRASTMMPLLAQVTIENPALHLIYESQMVENDPGMSDIPPVLNALWWGLGAGRDATFAVSNTANERAEADIFLDFQGARHRSAPLSLRPRETKVLSITELLDDLNISPAQAPEGGISIIGRDPRPSLIAQGKILDPSKGFSTTLNFPSPDMQRASALHASGVPIGTPTSDSPFNGAGAFVPHVAVRNLTSLPQNVTITIEYPGERGPEQTVLAPFALRGYATEDVSLDSAMRRLPLPLPYCSIRIQYSGPPGSAMAEVSSIERRGDLVVDGKLANEGDASAGSGGNPWHLDTETESTLFLTNMGDRNVRIGFQVQANGIHYYLTKLKLSPHETRAIDLRKLRDAQEPDYQGNKIPAHATDGSVLWAKFEKVPVMGRMVVVQRRKGMASSYSCFSCLCGSVQSFVAVTVTPPTVTGIPNDTQQFTCTEHKQDCHGTDFPSDITALAIWASSNTAVATISSTGFGTALDGGSTTFTGQFWDTEYDWDFAHGNCIERQTTAIGSALCTVQKPTFLLRTYYSASDSSTCGGASCQTLLAYRVLDGGGAPILRAGLQIQESVGNIQNFCNATISDSSSWTTDAFGFMIGDDQQHICCDAGRNCLFTDDQRFTVNQYTVLVTLDPLIGPAGTHNHIQLTCSNGHGTCAVITPSY